MTRSFNVLDRSLHLWQNYLLEASAGTGKTFSIENLVVRLLVESKDKGDPLSIENILVVTFTNAAVRDLKMRIRKNIEVALQLLGMGSHSSESGSIPDYLKAQLEKGEKSVNLAIKRLRQALFLFDQAQIFTIHSFCARKLRQFSIESDTAFHFTSGDKPLSQTELTAIIRDFFRTEIRSEKITPFELERYLRHDPDQKKLARLIQETREWLPYPTFEHYLIEFNALMKDINNSNGLCGEKVFEDFKKQAPAYSNYSKETKIQTLEKVLRFASLFDLEQWSGNNLEMLIEEGFVWTKALDPKLLKGSPPDPQTLHYPHLTQQLLSSVAPLVEEAGDVSRLLARMAHECKQHFIRYQHEEELFSPDDVLKKMHSALDKPLFRNKVSHEYQAVIIDEFQDTDPIQWQIFSRLFLPHDRSWKGYLVLVGDPKQSIYSFRQADIYTYLDAAQAIGKENCFSLSTNYRSQAPLVRALNCLFSQLSSFISLPKLARELPCPPVHAAKEEKPFDHKRGAIHFMIADCQNVKKATVQKMEERVFFPFIASEIVRLKNECGLSFRQFAILVRDRNQAARLTEYFTREEIPFVNQRGTSLVDSPALLAFTALIQALLQPRKRGNILAAFGSPLWGWTLEELKSPENCECILLLVQKLRTSLWEKGFSSFFQELLQSHCKPAGPTVMAYLLAKKEGLEFYHDLQQLADCISDHQFVDWHRPEDILPFLDQFQLWDQNDDERVKRFKDPAQEGVKILTLHMSKGLEFDIVFALGIANRDEMKDELMPIESNGRTLLTAVREESLAYERHCEERDSEKMRQLYVALTRAKQRVYVPAYVNLLSEKLNWGEASPFDLLVARLQQSAVSYQILYERMRNQTGSNLVDFIENFGACNLMTYSLDEEISTIHEGKSDAFTSPPLIPPSQVVVGGNPLWMSSFTSLGKRSEKSSENRSSMLNPPSDFKCTKKDVHSLPASSETGILIHNILERITFRDFELLTGPEQAVPLIRPFVQHTAFKEWEQIIAHLIFNALKTVLPLKPPLFSLSQIIKGNCYREMPFLFPSQIGEKSDLHMFGDDMIKGVFDLLFYHEGLYYLVDWKTNWLGPLINSYETDALHVSMHENDYFLQASLYTEAIRRYLKLVEERPFENCFGGIFYLFLRGMQRGNTTGVYRFMP